jgi:hypothetical protein
LYEDTLISVAPGTGSSIGGTSVTITGNSFLPGSAQVYFGGILATNVVVVNSTTITATTPHHPPGPVEVLVIQDGYAASMPGGFTYLFQSTISSLSPNRGYISGGNSVIINGTGFDIHAAATVTFSGIPATDIAVLSTTQIRVTTPAHAVGLVNVVVEQYGITATLVNGFGFVNPLTIHSVSPSRGQTDGGTVVTITGESFVPAGYTAAATFGDLEVLFGDAPCVVASVSDFTNTSITCTTGAHAAGLVDVTVSVGYGDNHTDTVTDGFLYIVFSLTLSVDSVQIELSPTSPTGAGSTAVSVRTDNPTGYSLMIRAENGDNALNCTIPGSTAKFQSITAAGPLSDNTWGLGLGSIEPYVWNPIPIVNTDMVPPVFTPTGPDQDGTADDSYMLWFGARVTQNQLACTYTAVLVITVVANI